MPTYCYKTEDGRTTERVFSMKDVQSVVFLEDGTPASRDYGAERKAVPNSKGWPLECVASGVHPDQAQALRDHLRGKGVPTEVSKDGNPIYRDARHRKRALKARGMYDRNSFF